MRHRPSGMILLFSCCLLVFPTISFGEEIREQRERMEAITKGLSKGEGIELRALEIRAKIHEPSVIYILDRARLEVDYGEQKIQFLPRIQDPIWENRF
jgi:hypothetical protein